MRPWAPDVSARATHRARWSSLPVARRAPRAPPVRSRERPSSRVRELLPFAGVRGSCGGIVNGSPPDRRGPGNTGVSSRRCHVPTTRGVRADRIGATDGASASSGYLTREPSAGDCRHTEDDGASASALPGSAVLPALRAGIRRSRGRARGSKGLQKSASGARSPVERPRGQNPRTTEGVPARQRSPSLTRRRQSRAWCSEATEMWRAGGLSSSTEGQIRRGVQEGRQRSLSQTRRGRKHHRRGAQRGGAVDRGSTRTALGCTRGSRDGCDTGRSWRFAVKRSSTWLAGPVSGPTSSRAWRPRGSRPGQAGTQGRETPQGGARHGVRPGIERSAGCS